jgi:CrcB protein
MIGGAVGSALRYHVGRLALAWFGPGYPWGTLAVNLIGGFVMGLLVGALGRLAMGGENWRLLLGVGVLGGFTTFSAFSLETALMIERGELLTAATYVAASVTGAIVAVFIGLTLARSFT